MNINFVEEPQKPEIQKKQFIHTPVVNENTAVNVWLVDKHFNYTFFNDVHQLSMKEVWGTDIRLGKCLFDYISDRKYRKKVENNYKKILSGKPHRSIDNFTLESGEQRYYENFGNPIYTPDGHVNGIIFYSIDITRKTEQEETLRLTNSLLQSIMNSPDNIHILSIDKEYKYLFFNNAHSNSMQEVWQAKPEIGVNIFDILPDSAHRSRVKPFYDRSLQGEIVTQTSEILDKTGKKMYFQNISAPIFNVEGDIEGITVFIFNTTEKEIAQQITEKSLKEKEVLLKEIHHRVKNNLQTITSMINLQMNMVNNSTVQRILQDSLNRINTMGIIHETLYQGENVGEINMINFCRLLIDSITSFYNTSEPTIEIITNIDKINLSINQAIPVGLIITELITNSMKYAFEGMMSGIISVKLTSSKPKEFHLQVKDNGRGLLEDLNINNTDSLGIKLVSVFTEQLKGRIDYKSDDGVTVNIYFNSN